MERLTTLYTVSIRQQKNSRFSIVAEMANISLANQVTRKSTSEFKGSWPGCPDSVKYPAELN